MLDYRIDTFLKLCQLMNYRKTAEALGITQPAVTQQIRHLEKLFDCQLFRYEKHTLIKTDAAIVLEQYSRAAKLQVEYLQKKLQNPDIQELKIGATKTIGDYFLSKFIFRFLDSQNHSLNLIVDNTEHLLVALEQRELDFAIVEGFFDKKRFDSILVRREPFVGICRKDHPFAGREVTIEELLQETIIHREDGSGTRAILEQELSGYNESLYRFHKRICISSFKLILELVKGGYGISFVYNILADTDPELGKFTIKGEQVVREFNIVYLKHADLSEKIGWFFGGNDA